MTILKLDKIDGIAIITMDDPDQPQNVLNEALQEEFETVISDIEGDSSLRAMIFTSGKKGCFVAGADIQMFGQIESAEQAAEMCGILHKMFQRFADLSIVTVAAIDGACLGGGLELALVFDYRIATTDKSTKIGVPEVQLGILPGGGGTQRIPRLIDLPTALDLLLTGKQLNAKRAKKAGLVDAAVAPEILLDVAKKFAAKGKPVREKSWKEKVMSLSPARALIISQARKQMLKMTKGKYPAPKKILETVEQGLSTNLAEGLKI
jgi:3-hydroxyacyl-CoA dehydrogenase/enoyl-CoA hydratase/3-hydroxybutyryl-CoA epimerase